jgi:DNA (cytosine-5)-methyltransferase 1
MVSSRMRVAELFAGVGGFRLGLEGHAPTGRSGSGWQVVWSNQWEPGTKKQYASECYVARFGPNGHVNEDIAKVLDDYESGKRKIPNFDLLVGGFPCQDYSVARVLSQAAGLEGKKGVLWWEIFRLLRRKKPKYILLENVDRLLKSPAIQRGRDFAVMLRCLAELGYSTEWRVVNAADYGLPQRRRRVFIIGERTTRQVDDPVDLILHSGVLARALPVTPADEEDAQLSLAFRASPSFVLDKDPMKVSREFRGEFENAGVMNNRLVWTTKVRPDSAEDKRTLSSILLQDAVVPEEFYIPDKQLPQWTYLKGPKREQRTVAGTGFKYFYSEGGVGFPEPLNEPSRTILTGEGGSSPSRFKHVVRTPDGRYRRLTPIELERLDGFPDGWTEGMPDTRRAFMMGNALVVGVIERIGAELARRARRASARVAARSRSRSA